MSGYLPTMSAEDRFAAIADELRREPGIDVGTGFGTNPGLRIGGRIFAMMLRDELVVKLPVGRCEELTRDAGATAFQVGNRKMREWVSVPDEPTHDWAALGREALAYVRG
jgi:hypothetical protein